MRLVSICIFASLISLHLTESAVAGTRWTAASVHASGSASDPKIDPRIFLNSDNGEDSSDSGGLSEAVANAPMDKGESHAIADAGANAEIGHLGVFVLGSSLGAPRNRPGTVSVGGYATSSADALAEWIDTISIVAPGHIAIRGVFKLSIEGEVAALAFGNAAAQASASVAIPFESKLLLRRTSSS
jgi:hypothetical protein